MEKILFIGSSGIYTKSNIVGGQIAKNRVLFDYFEKNNINFVHIDTTNWKKRIIYLAVVLMNNLLFRNYKYVITSLAGMSAVRILKLLTVINKIKHLDIIHFVIGGNIIERIKKNPSFKFTLLKCNRVCVESKKIVADLNYLGIQNAIYIPNFRSYNFNLIRMEVNKPLRLLFFSRVSKAKGIELAIEAVKKINFKKGNLISFDIYGPIEKSYESTFFKIINSEKRKFIAYKGILEMNKNETYSTLSQYDLMLFPTYHEGEGFPGAIIDSYIAGVPVLASDWRYNSEIVSDGKTGRLFKVQSLDDLIEKVKWFIEHPEKIIEMKFKCVKEAKKYHINYVISKLLTEIEQ